LDQGGVEKRDFECEFRDQGRIGNENLAPKRWLAPRKRQGKQKHFFLDDESSSFLTPVFDLVTECHYTDQERKRSEIFIPSTTLTENSYQPDAPS
jgi:hypothetical protein